MHGQATAAISAGGGRAGSGRGRCGRMSAERGGKPMIAAAVRRGRWFGGPGVLLWLVRHNEEGVRVTRESQADR